MNQSSTMQRPQSDEYAAFYSSYVSLVPEADIIQPMERQLREIIALLRNASEQQATVLHPPYTWTVKQVVNHISDGERIFAYRALRIARGDQTPLPGFNENDYAQSALSERVRLNDLVDEYETVRRATLSLFRNLPAEAWANKGIANDSPISVRAIAWIIVGHVRHHQAIISKRLGKE